MPTAETLALSVDNNVSTYPQRMALARRTLAEYPDRTSALEVLAIRVRSICVSQARLERLRFGTLHSLEQIEAAAKITAETLAEHLRDGA